MWSRDDFLQLVREDSLTFGAALGEQADALAEVLADDARVDGFLVNLQRDESTGEPSVWTVHVLTDATLLWFAADREGRTSAHRYAPDAFAGVSMRSLGIDRAPTDGVTLHAIRNLEARADLRVGGGYVLFSGSEWYDQWGGNVTDLAVTGAAAFFRRLLRMRAADLR